MTDTTTEEQRPPVVPEGKHWSNLTVGELGYAGRELGADIVHATSVPGDPYRVEAYAWAAYLWARRADPAVRVQDFMALELVELGRLLRLNVRRDADTDTAPDREPEDDPTDSAPGSSSPARGDASPTTS